MGHPFSGKMLAEREKFREKTQPQDGVGRRSLSSFLNYLYQVFDGHILAQIGRGGKKPKVRGWLMWYVEEVMWSADWGLSNLLHPGKSNARPQMSGVFQVHFTSLGAAVLCSPRQVVPMLLNLSPVSLYFMC